MVNAYTKTTSLFVLQSAQKPILRLSSRCSGSECRMYLRTMVSILQVQTKEISRLCQLPITRNAIYLMFTYSQPQIFSVLWQAMKAPSMRPILTCITYLRKPPRIRSQYSRQKLSNMPRCLSIQQSLYSRQFSTSQRIGAHARDLISNTQGLLLESKPRQSICDRSIISWLTWAYRQQFQGSCTGSPRMRAEVSSFECVRKYSITWPKFMSTSLPSGMKPWSDTIASTLASTFLRKKVVGFLKELIQVVDLFLVQSIRLSMTGSRKLLKMQNSAIRGLEMLEVDEINWQLS